MTSKTDKQVISGFHRPVCLTCGCELRPEQNGVGVLDMADYGPYELWDADIWKCPRCGIQMVGGFGCGPISAHYKDDFKAMQENYKKHTQLVVNVG